MVCLKGPRSAISCAERERKKKKKKKEQRKRERERDCCKGLWVLVCGYAVGELVRNLKREEEGGAGGGLPLSFLPLTKFIQPLPRGKLPKRDPFRAKQPKNIQKYDHRTLKLAKNFALARGGNKL